MNQPVVSLIICTRNRAAQLEQSLSSITQLAFDEPWQLILVNNASTDRTDAVISAFIKSSSLNVTYVREARPGLSRARNRGLAEAKADIIAFTDDDCYPARDFLTHIYHCLKTEGFDFCGGRVLLYDQADAKLTIQESECREIFAADSIISSGLIIGANFAVKRSSILAINGFDERIGAGTRYAAGEDTDVMRRMLNQGMKGVSDPQIVVYHHHGRQKKRDIKNITRNYSKGRGACMAKQLYFTNTSKRHLLKTWYWNLKASSLYQVFYELLYAFIFSFEHKFNRRLIVNHPAESLST